MGVRAYVIRLSQITSFFSYCHDKNATLADVVKHCVESKREVPRGVRNSKVRRQDKPRRDWSRH